MFYLLLNGFDSGAQCVFYLLLNGFDSGTQMRNIVVLHVDGTHRVLEQVQVVGELLGEEDVHLLDHRVVLFIRHPDLQIR